MLQLTNALQELATLYDEWGSEIPEKEVVFIEQMLSRAMNKGTEYITKDEAKRIGELVEKYSSPDYDPFDSDEQMGEE
jgi:hypothetical protein